MIYILNKGFKLTDKKSPWKSPEYGMFTRIRQAVDAGQCPDVNIEQLYDQNRNKYQWMFTQWQMSHLFKHLSYMETVLVLFKIKSNIRITPESRYIKTIYCGTTSTEH